MGFDWPALNCRTLMVHSRISQPGIHCGAIVSRYFFSFAWSKLCLTDRVRLLVEVICALPDSEWTENATKNKNKKGGERRAAEQRRFGMVVVFLIRGSCSDEPKGRVLLPLPDTHSGLVLLGRYVRWKAFSILRRRRPEDRQGVATGNLEINKEQ